LSLTIVAMCYATLTFLGIVAGAGACTPDLSLKHRCLVDSDCVAGRTCAGGECRATAAGDASSAEDAGAADGGVSGADGKGGDGGDGVGILPGVRPNVVFVTSEKIELRFESLDVADEKCNAAARAAGLPGEYRAWLSTVDVDARDRLGSARGWVRPDGVPFADTLEDIVNGRILNPPALDELGVEIPPEDDYAVATATNPFGYHAPGFDCDDWTSGESTTMLLGGRARATTDHWTFYSYGDCSAPGRIYCFGVDQSFPVAPAPVAGKRAFISDKMLQWSPGGASADAHCAAEAADAGLSGSFLALLPMMGAAAASRFASPPGTVWLRMDGVPINAPGSDLFAEGPLLTPLNVTAKGRYLGYLISVDGVDRVFAGGHTPRSSYLGCNGWSGTPPNRATTFGRYTAMNHWWFETFQELANCGEPARVYCFEP
jgi:hypothetical protein